LSGLVACGSHDAALVSANIRWDPEAGNDPPAVGPHRRFAKRHGVALLLIGIVPVVLHGRCHHARLLVLMT